MHHRRILTRAVIGFAIVVSASIATPAATPHSVAPAFPTDSMMAVATPFAATPAGFEARGEQSGIAALVLRDGGVRLANGASLATEPARAIGLRLTRLGRASGAGAAPAVRGVEVEHGRVLVDRGVVREWYVSAARGLEQGFDLLARPARSTGGADDRVVLALTVEGARASNTREAAIDFVSLDGTTLARYAELSVVDARGRSLPSSMHVVDGAIELAYDDRDARYPVRVDPIAFATPATLAAPMLTADADCGAAVAIAGTLAVVGCPMADGPMGEQDSGLALLFTKSNGTWAFLQALQPSAVVAGARFGRSVAMNGRIAVGAPGENVGGALGGGGGAGRVYVYVDASVNGWLEAAAITAPDASAGLAFGASVAIEADVLAVGAPGGSLAASNVVGGTVYLFGLSTNMTPVFGFEIGGPATASGDEFGASVALSSGRLAVGAPLVDAPGMANAGAAYVFKDGGAGAPGLEGALVDSAPVVEGRFGYDVDIDGTTAVVGCPRATTVRGLTSGAVGVYQLEASWTEVARLIAPDGTAADLLGTSVAIDGEYIVGGTPGTISFSAVSRTGAAYLYAYDAGAFRFAAKLKPADILAGDALGFDVGLDAASQSVIVGVPLDDVSGVLQAGTARVFGIPAFEYLYVNVHGPGSGTVASVPDGIGCGTDCFEAYGTGTTVSLTPTAAAGSYLASVSGACSSLPCSPSMSTTRTVDFVFELQRANGQDCTKPVECLSNACTDGVCCNVACGNGAPDCQACSVEAGGTTDGTCTALAGTVAAATVCRPGGGECDAPEHCDPNSTVCPADVRFPAGYECHPSLSAICDPAETCNGTSVECPVDVHATPGTPCGNGLLCDGVESCSQSGACLAPAVPMCPDDGNPCTVDLCLDPVGCLSVPQPGCTVVDGGAVFADAGAPLDGSVDGAVDDAGPIVPPPPNFVGQGGCSCRVAGSPMNATPEANAFGSLAFLGVLLAALVRGYRRNRAFH